MANKNRNRQENQSWGQSRDWEQNRPQRVSRANDYTQDYENYGSENMDYEQGDQNRYLNTGGYGNYGSSGLYASGRGRLDQDHEGYGYHTRAGFGNNYSQNDWQRERNVSNHNDQNQWRNQNRGNSGGYQGSSYGNRNFDQYNPSGNMYGGDTRNYGNANQGAMDRDWWDKTRDTVKGWFGDDEARRRHEQDKQYAALHRGKGPKGYARSEDRIREDVNDKLTDDPFIDASDIDVKVEDCVVILSGTVENREDKRRAEDIIERVSGVKDVENRLRVKTDTSSRYESGSRGDREIENFK